MEFLTSEEDECNSDWDKDHSFISKQQISTDCLKDLIDGYISQSLVIFNSIIPSTSFCQFSVFLTSGFASRLYAFILLYSLVL